MTLPTERSTAAGARARAGSPSAPPQSKIMTTRTGLILPPRLTIDAWKEIGEELSVLWDSTCWWQGDWLLYGQDRYPDRYQRAVEDSGLDYQTLRNYAWAARRFPPSRRRPKLSLQHHAEVASLPEEDQDLWLDRAEREGWSRNRLRRHLQDHEAGGRRLGAAADGTLALKVPAGRQERWRRAAERRGSALSSWIAHVLDQAAEQALEASRPATASASAPASGPHALHRTAADGPARRPGELRPVEYRGRLPRPRTAAHTGAHSGAA
ncbi:LmbU family transcriptional regulator [Actinomadura fibrosa]|uniref:LmbU family transcriptional regulator n=1 Tax=Actinomadura fibrosa TaxID=111802 RepID=A0ABW2XWQ0_9ACTN|nr:LmbU family transcriptional regulator [Actinomadura fibrosa]